MSIEDLFVSGYTAIKNTEGRDAGGAVTNTLSTDTDIGTDGVFSAHQRQLSGDEILRYARFGVEEVARFYTQVTGLTTEHLITDLDGKEWNIINIDDPHDLGMFLQIDASRRSWKTSPLLYSENNVSIITEDEQQIVLG